VRALTLVATQQSKLLEQPGDDADRVGAAAEPEHERLVPRLMVLNDVQIRLFDVVDEARGERQP